VERPTRFQGLTWAVATAALSFVAGALADAAAPSLPESKLAVLSGSRWVHWWDAAHPPSAWRASDAVVSGAVGWRPAAAAMERGELRLAGSGEAWRLKVVLVRFDPARLRLELVEANREGGTLAAWSLDDTPRDAVLAFNAGQFTGGVPWGWLVRGGRIEQPAGTGALSMAFCVLSSGEVRFVPTAAIPSLPNGIVAEAFQSYPALLRGDGDVPSALATAGLGVDLEHRDTRLAIGELRDGRWLVALTRFAVAGDALGALPFGPTVPEMAAVMGALGCRRAVMLDGGISAQLAVREPGGGLLRWRGLRDVPLALVAYPR
jgi:hypothetical protein